MEGEDPNGGAATLELWLGGGGSDDWIYSAAQLRVRLRPPHSGRIAEVLAGCGSPQPILVTENVLGRDGRAGNGYRSASHGCEFLQV